MNEDQARRIMIEYCRRLYDKGFVPGVDGNISMRVDGNRMLITPTGVCKGAVTEEQLSLLGLNGEHLSGGRPSSETPMHMAALNLRREVNAVIHAHSPNIGAFALAGEPVDTRCSSFSYFHLGIIGEIPYITPGTEQLHEAVKREVKKGSKALILFGHGSMVLGSDMREAFEKIDLFEAYAGMLLRAQLLGGAKPLSDDELLKVKGG